MLEFVCSRWKYKNHCDFRHTRTHSCQTDTHRTVVVVAEVKAAFLNISFECARCECLSRWYATGNIYV